MSETSGAAGVKTQAGAGAVQVNDELSVVCCYSNGSHSQEIRPNKTEKHSLIVLETRNIHTEWEECFCESEIFKNIFVRG